MKKQLDFTKQKVDGKMEDKIEQHDLLHILQKILGEKKWELDVITILFLRGNNVILCLSNKQTSRYNVNQCELFVPKKGGYYFYWLSINSLVVRNLL